MVPPFPPFFFIVKTALCKRFTRAAKWGNLHQHAGISPADKDRAPMNHSITLSYQLTEDLWRQFYEAHYAADPSLRMRYFWGGLCIALGALGLGGLFDSRIIAILLLLTGFYGVLSQPLFVLKSLATARRHPYFGKDLTVQLAADGITVRSSDAIYQQGWNEFSSYRKVKAGFMFYFKNDSFFFIPAAVCPPAIDSRIERLIEQAGLERKGQGKRPRS
jgi:hypothetical protein